MSERPVEFDAASALLEQQRIDDHDMLITVNANVTHLDEEVERFESGCREELKELVAWQERQQAIIDDLRQRNTQLILWMKIMSGITAAFIAVHVLEIPLPVLVKAGLKLVGI